MNRILRASKIMKVSIRPDPTVSLFMITFNLIDRMMCFNENDLDRDFYVDNILFEFSNYELLFCID